MERFRRNRFRKFLSRLRLRKKNTESPGASSEEFDFTSFNSSPDVPDDHQMDFYPYVDSLVKETTPPCSAPQEVQGKEYGTLVVGL